MSEVIEKVPASLGKVERININLQATEQDNAGASTQNDELNADGTPKNAAAPKVEDKQPEFTDEQISKYLESQGIGGFKTIAELKTKLETPAAAAQVVELTPEEKSKAEAAHEKVLLDLYLTAPGAKPEGFVAMKNILTMDLKDISIKDIRESMKGEFDEAQIEAVIQERYYQKNPDELEQGADELYEDFEARKEDYKKKHDYGVKKLNARGQAIKDKASNFFKTLNTAIEQSNLSQRELEESEKKLLSKTDEIFSKIPKKVTFELGKGTDGADMAPVHYDVDDADIETVKSILKDPTQRNNILYTPEGELNVESIGSILMENANLKKALQVVALEATSRTVAEFRKTFPHFSAQSLGLGNNGTKNVNNGNTKGIPASMGKTQRVNAGR